MAATNVFPVIKILIESNDETKLQFINGFRDDLVNLISEFGKLKAAVDKMAENANLVNQKIKLSLETQEIKPEIHQLIIYSLDDLCGEMMLVREQLLVATDKDLECRQRLAQFASTEPLLEGFALALISDGMVTYHGIVNIRMSIIEIWSYLSAIVLKMKQDFLFHNFRQVLKLADKLTTMDPMTKAFTRWYQDLVSELQQIDDLVLS